MRPRRFLVAYDIRNPKRLRKTCKIVEGFGDRIQYSVFICDLAVRVKEKLVNMILQVIDTFEDSVIIIDLGYPDESTRLFSEFFGVDWQFQQVRYYVI
jgi:CRISPR-associated protein Cas2